jgi:thiosulfate dehydrogenase [quinone] large subunit
MQRQQSAYFQWAGIAISVVAGAWTIYHIVLGIQTPGKSDYNDAWGIGLLVLFGLALILAFVQFFQDRSSLLPTSSTDQFPEPAIAKFFFGSAGAAPMWFVVRMNVGAEWLLAGYEKIKSPVWGTNGTALAGFVKGALAKANGANPSVQGWYSWFLQHIVQNNTGLFSFLVTWGEFAVGLGVLLGVLTGIASGFGVLMNLNYLLAGTVSINPVLGVFGLFLVFAWRVAGQIGGDSFLLPALGLPWKRGTLFGGSRGAAAKPAT